MFIMSRRNIELPCKDGAQIHRVAKDFVGEIPDWAAGTPYFRALVADGKIVVPASTKDKDLTAAEEESDLDKAKLSEDEPAPGPDDSPDKAPPKASMKKGK